jgi:hypothetical protein
VSTIVHSSVGNLAAKSLEDTFPFGTIVKLLALTIKHCAPFKSDVHSPRSAHDPSVHEFGNGHGHHCVCRV